MANEETPINDSPNSCRARQKKLCPNNEKRERGKRANIKQTDLWLLFQQADNRACGITEKEREGEREIVG